MGRGSTIEKNLVPMILKSFRVLDSFREKPDGLTYTELIERNKEIPKISIYRILCSLESLGYLTKDPETNRYELGTKFIELGRITEKRQGVIRMATPYMQRILDAYGENVNLTKIENAELVNLKTLEGTHPLRVMQLTNRGQAVYSSASGKIMLALMPESQRNEVLDRLSFEPLTPKTIVPRPAFARELETVRERGYGVDDEENLVGVRCVGAAIRNGEGYPVAAISLTGPSSRVTFDMIERIAADLCAAADELSAESFGWRGGGAPTVRAG